MVRYTTITYTLPEGSSTPVSIAGNFNNWQIEPLAYVESSGRWEYTIKPSSDSDNRGKYVFKFIVNGQWLADSNYSLETDPAGNENNVIIYDYTDSPSDEEVAIDNKTIKAVEEEVENEPSTPNPTPHELSKQPTSTENANTGFNPLVLTSEAPEEEEVVTEQSTTASKQLPKTADTSKENKFIPLTETANGTPRTETDAKPQYFENIKPPVETSTPGAFRLNTAPSTEDEEEEDENETTISKRPLSNNNNNASSSDDASRLGFFATILHLIAQFFRNWFTSGGHS